MKLKHMGKALLLNMGDFLHNFAYSKPARLTGGTHLGDLVATRHCVTLCATCVQRYVKGDRWWKREEYIPDWDYYWRSNCDGCGSRGVLCASLYPRENAYRVMDSDTHFHQSAPSGHFSL